MKKLYIIGGTMGVGKTTVSKYLNKELPNAVFLDGDWCWNASPFQVTEETKTMVLQNICFLLNNFIKCSTYENIIFCWVMHEQYIIDTILHQIDVSECEVRVVSLVADADTLTERIMKDVAAGLRTEDGVATSVARIPLYEKLQCEKIDTVGKTVAEIAKEILKEA